MPIKLFGEMRYFITHIQDFLALLISRFMLNNGLQNAASMTYTTLLSLVPLLAVAIAVFSVFPVADKVSADIQAYLFEHFVPASSDVLQTYLDEFSGKAAKMTGTSFIFLVLVAIMLMASIDRAFNAIWRVKKKRSMMKMLLVYWAVISLGPLLMALSIAVTSYVVSLPLLTEASEVTGVSKLLVLMPVLMSTLAFTILYAAVPNRNVPLRHALAGGLVAAVLFEIAKRGFGFYVTNFPTYEAIYGAMATVPIFLVWLYLSWVVTLLGAEFTYCLGVYRRQKKPLEWQGDHLLDVLEILGLLWQAQVDGSALSLEQITDQIPGYTEERMENLLLKMHKAQLIHQTHQDHWVLGRDLGTLSLTDLYRLQPLILPNEQQVKRYEGVAASRVKALMNAINSSVDEQMNLSLESLFSTESATNSSGHNRPT